MRFDPKHVLAAVVAAAAFCGTSRQAAAQACDPGVGGGVPGTGRLPVGIGGRVGGLRGNVAIGNGGSAGALQLLNTAANLQSLARVNQQLQMRQALQRKMALQRLAGQRVQPVRRAARGRSRSPAYRSRSGTSDSALQAGIEARRERRERLRELRRSLRAKRDGSD